MDFTVSSLSCLREGELLAYTDLQTAMPLKLSHLHQCCHKMTYHDTAQNYIKREIYLLNFLPPHTTYLRYLE